MVEADARDSKAGCDPVGPWFGIADRYVRPKVACQSTDLYRARSRERQIGDVAHVLAKST
jgi:hypothetical protein